MLAARHAVIFAMELGIQQSHFKGDLKSVIKTLKMGTMFSLSFGHLARDTLAYVSSLRSFSFSHTVRQGNAVTHALTKEQNFLFRY